MTFKSKMSQNEVSSSSEDISPNEREQAKEPVQKPRSKPGSPTAGNNVR